MRPRHARLLWSVPLLAAMACSGESDPTGPAAPDGGLSAAKGGTRVIEVSPGTDPVSFGTVQGPFESATPTTQTFTVTNVGNRVTSALAVSITGGGAAAYSIESGDDGCTGKSLGLSGRSKSCTVKVTFAPAEAGSYTAVLNVTVAQPKATVTVNLSGTGSHGTSITIRSVVTGAPASISFSTSGGLFPATFDLADGGSQAFTPAPGSYGVSAVPPAGYDLRSVVCVDPGQSTSVSGATASITIADGGTVECTFTAAEIVTLRGTVFNDNDINGGKAAAEPGYSGATVRLKSGDGATTLAQTTSDANGLYAFSDVAPGSYTIEVEAPAGTAITSANAQPRSVTVTNTSVNGLDFGLASYTHAGLVNVRVNGFCGAGNPGAAGVTARVYTYALPNGAWTLFTTSTTGSDGIFRVLLPLNAAGQGYIVEVPGVLTTSLALTVASPTRVLSWYGCTP